MFCVNREIESKIRSRASKTPRARIELADILLWSIFETFTDTRRCMPLWAVQGERYLKQKQIWDDILADGVNKITSSHARKFLEPEAQTLEDRYRPKHSQTVMAEMERSTVPRMNEIRERCSQFDGLQYNASALQEEQERELSPEIEQERQVQRLAKARPSSHSLHADVVGFVQSGQLKSASTAYMPAFQAFRGTPASAGFPLYQLDGDKHLLATADFARTIESACSSTSASDSYQRSVQWILATHDRTTTTSPYLMVISPFEAEALMPQLRQSTKVSLHLYKARCNKEHPTFDKLDFFSIPANANTQHIPRSLLLRLDLFAGQLYLNTYEDYLEICAFLGLATDVPKDNEIIAADGFILRDGNGVKRGKSPVKFLQALMSNIRRNGQGIGKTDMGYILEGKLLERSHFEGSSTTSSHGSEHEATDDDSSIEKLKERLARIGCGPQ